MADFPRDALPFRLKFARPNAAQACKALKEEGYTVVLVNSNPATIMTDPEFADLTYTEPTRTARRNRRHGGEQFRFLGCAEGEPCAFAARPRITFSRA